MYKIATCLTVVLLTSFVSVKLIDFQPDESLSPWVEGQRMEDKLTAYKCFKQTLESALDELRKGDISLREAHARVHASASRYYPQFLVHLAWSEPGNTAAERLAHNLVEH